jgi:ATP-dependent DNA ligase
MAKQSSPMPAASRYSTSSAASGHGGDAVLIAFDLIELDGEDLRRSPI